MFLSTFGFTAVMLPTAALPGQAEEPNRQANATVTGRVMTEPNGKPVAGVVITLWNGAGAERLTATTDEKGSYSFSKIVPGEHYRIWIEERPNKEEGRWSEWVVVRFKDRLAQVDDCFLELPQSLSGTVTDEESGKPVPNAEINFSTADRNRDSIKTDSKGQFRLFVSPRDVDLVCNGTRERYNGNEQHQQVTVAAGKHVKDIDFKLRSAPKFTGVVVHPDGKPAKGAEVIVEVRGPSRFPRGGFDGIGQNREFRLTTDEEGRFVGYMAGPRDPNTMELKVIARPLDHTSGGVVKAETTFEAKYKLDPLKIVLARSSRVMVRVVDPDGKPVTSAEVVTSNYPGWDTGLGGPTKHVGDGKYLVMGLIPGLEYYLIVKAAGLQGGMHSLAIVLKPDETRTLEVIRLEWWGKKAVPRFVKLLKSADMYDRETAARQLGSLGSDAADAVPALVDKLRNDPRNTVRYNVAAALGQIGPSAKPAVLDLIVALRDDTGGGVQREAAKALGLIGDLSAIPALKDALKLMDSDVTNAATEAIKRLEGLARRGT